MANLIPSYQLRVSDYFFLSSEDDFLITIEFFNSDFIFSQRFRYYRDFLFTQYQSKYELTGVPFKRFKLGSITITDSSLYYSFISQIKVFYNRFQEDLDFKYIHL